MKNKFKRILGYSAPVIAVLICVAFRLSQSKGMNPLMSDLSVIYHDSDIIIHGEGQAIIPPFYTSGEHLTIEGVTLNAVPTPDRENLVVLDASWNLYVTDCNLSSKVLIDNYVNSILAVRDEGILYRDSKNRFYRYLFADGSVLSLGKCRDYQISEEGFTIAYADKWGKVNVLTVDSTEKKKIGTYKGIVDIVAVAEDGNMVVYGSDVLKTENVMFYDNGTLTKLCELVGMNNTLSSVWVKAYEGENGTSLAVIPCMVTGTKVYVKHPGKEIMPVELDFFPAASSCYTSEGLFVPDFFSDKVVWVNPDTGEFQTLLSSVEDYVIYGNQITYLSKDGELYCAEIHEGKVMIPTLIDSKVSYFQCTPNGRDTYYYKNADAKEKYYDLFVYEKSNFASDVAGNSVAEVGIAPVKVDSNVLYDYEIKLSFSTDEETVYYFTKGEKYLIDVTETSEGTSYNYGNENVLKRYTPRGTLVIETDTVPGSLSSGRTDELIENSSFIYQKKYSSISAYTWQYFDGTGSFSISGQANHSITDDFEENPYVPIWRY